MDTATTVSYQSRICVWPVIAGIMLTLASMFFFMSLAAALGIWTYRPEELPMLGPKFWTVASLAWTASVFLGTFLAAMSTRSKEFKDGLLNAITTWAGSYLLFGGIALSIVESNLNALLGAPTVGLFWHGFLGDVMALCGGVSGGLLGTYVERRTFQFQFGGEEAGFFENAPTRY
jgi:hypothetical protein